MSLMVSADVKHHVYLLYAHITTIINQTHPHIAGSTLITQS